MTALVTAIKNQILFASCEDSRLIMDNSKKMLSSFHFPEIMSTLHRMRWSKSTGRFKAEYCSISTSAIGKRTNCCTHLYITTARSAEFIFVSHRKSSYTILIESREGCCVTDLGKSNYALTEVRQYAVLRINAHAARVGFHAEKSSSEASLAHTLRPSRAKSKGCAHSTEEGSQVLLS